MAAMSEELRLSDRAQALADDVRRAAGKLSSLRDLADDWESGRGTLITEAQAAEETRTGWLPYLRRP
jgi:hypothetical protein